MKPKRVPVAKTFDEAQELWRANCSHANFLRYKELALEYWFDEMISDGTLLAALHELRS